MQFNLPQYFHLIENQYVFFGKTGCNYLAIYFPVCDAKEYLKIFKINSKILYVNTIT